MSVFEPFNRQKACRHGQMLYNFNDLFIGRSLDLYGEYCEGEVDLYRQIIQPGSFVIEAGANIGVHTVFMAQQTGPQGAVMAFEPQRVIHQNLCANMAINSIPNAICSQQAVGSAPGTVLVPSFDYRHQANYGGISLGQFEAGEPVPVVTLDSLNLRVCHFIKIDVEGMEQEVINGARDLLARVKPVLYVENDREAKSHDLVRLLDSLEYNMYWHFVPYYSPSNFFGNPNNAFGNAVAKNMVCVHKSLPQNLQGFQRVAVPPPVAAAPVGSS